MSETPVQPIVLLTDSPIDASHFAAAVGSPEIGAQVFFHGVTRRQTVVGDETLMTQTLFYEAHPTMALAMMRQLADEAIRRFAIARVVLVHRLGEVPVGQTSVLVGCGGGHRRATLDAVAWLMDELKRDVPIWKQERYESSPTQWIHPE